MTIFSKSYLHLRYFFLRITSYVIFVLTLYTHTHTYTHTHAYTHTHSGEVLALDLLEEWMGLRIKLEVVSNTSNHLHTLSGIKTNLGPRSNINTLNSDKNGINGNNGNNNNNGNENGRNEMSSWVADVGVGKEWEKVVGYWRFSDLIKYGDLGFCNTGIPGARGVFLDLSKYGVPLEIFGGVESVSKVCLGMNSIFTYYFVFLFCLFI